MIKPLSKTKLTENKLSKHLKNPENNTEVFDLDSIIPLRVGDLTGNVLPELNVNTELIITNK